MHFLFLSILCSVGIAHLFQWAGNKQCPTFGLFVINYAVASIMAIAACHGYQSDQLSPGLLGMGIGVGVLFVAGFGLFMFTIKKLGVTIPVSLMRLSAVLPTLGSIVFFHEIPGPWQIAGISLAFVSLPLASREPTPWRQWRTLFHKGFGWGLVLFIVFGTTDFMLKVQTHLVPVHNPYFFLALVFPTAFVITAGVVWYQHIRLTRMVIIYGVFLGILNLFSTVFFLHALGDLAGILVFPSNGIGIILLSSVTSAWIWKERLGHRNQLFIALACVALFLLYR